MAADSKIAGLFNLPVECPPLCDEASCIFFVDYLSKFYKGVAENKSRHPWVSKAELDALGSSLKTLQATTPHEKVDWLPEYGCALLKSEAGCTSGVIALNLISLDLHQFQTTSKLSADSYNYIDNAIALDYEVLNIGTCTLGDLEDLQDKFQKLLASAKCQTGNNRSARGGKQGHQRTPAFIHALYREAFGSPNAVPRGGMTDVGLHTGHQQKRDTSPPLVFYSLRQALNDRESQFEGVSSDGLFKKTAVYFALYVSEVTIQQYKGKESSIDLKTNAPDILLEHAFRVLRAASIKAAEFSLEGLDMSNFADCSKEIHAIIVKEASSQSELYSRLFELPQSDKEIRGQFENYNFHVPARYSPAKDCALSESEICKNTHRNLGWLSTVSGGKSLEDLGKWVEKSRSTSSRDVLLSMLVLKTVEGVMWNYAKTLPVMKQNELETLASIVDKYREVLHNFKVAEKYKPLSLVQLKSRELLIVWVGKSALIIASRQNSFLANLPNLVFFVTYDSILYHSLQCSETASCRDGWVGCSLRLQGSVPSCTLGSNRT